MLNASIDYRAPYMGNGGRFWGCTHQEIFVGMYKFLISSAASSLGIVRRAWNKGNTSLPMGIGFNIPSAGLPLDYWDVISTTSTPAGNNAFAVFEFTQATPPLWILLQYAGQWPVPVFGAGSQFGGIPGDPAYADTNLGGSTNTVALACAFRKDGSSPWNGTTANNGSDTKNSTLVWNSGSIIFPRASGFGTTANPGLSIDTTAAYMMRLTPHDSPIGVGGSPSFSINVLNASASLDAASGIYHLIASKDSLMALVDARGNGNYNMAFVGKYDPLSTSVTEGLNWANYVCLQSYNIEDSYKRTMLPRYGDATSLIYGPKNGSEVAFVGTNSITDGGINDVLTNRVESCIIDQNLLLSESNESVSGPINLRHPNRFLTDPSGRSPGVFDMFTVPLACYGENYYFGHVGEISSFRMVFGLPTNSTINGRKYAVFGNTSLNTIKIVVPWDGATTPGIPAGRDGIPW
jgi:hypothetical protein